jgi:predicted metal-binding protein
MAEMRHDIRQMTKTLVVCRKCHEDIHAGKTTTPFRKQGLESRVRGKLACSVREGGNEEGP